MYVNKISRRFSRAILASLLLSVAACGSHYSDGERTGTVVKLSEKGIFFKSWEGEMASSGMTQGAANILDFNVEPSEVKNVQAALASGKPVRIHYHQWFMAPLTIENDHVVDMVTPEPTPSQ